MTENSHKTTSKKKPIHTVRFGCAKVAVWENERGYRNLTIERLYKDDNDAWQSTRSFGRDDLPKLIKALEAAYERLFASEDSKAENGE